MRSMESRAVLLLLLAVATASGVRAEPLFASFPDPIGDHEGSIDLVRMEFSLNGLYEARYVASALHPFAGRFEIRTTLFNSDTDSSPITLSTEVFSLSAPTTEVIVMGRHPALILWGEGDRVAATGPEFASAVLELPSLARDLLSSGSVVISGSSADQDDDSIPDDVDNCTEVPNADQRDTDGDGFGNLCDPDLNGDGITDFLDLGLMKSVFFTDDPDADLNGDGSVDFLDLGMMKSLFFQPPGPSGLECAGTVPCP